MMIANFQPDYRRPERISLQQATDQLLNDLERSNPSMRITRNREGIRDRWLQA
jgi:hypothetical protein